MMLHILQRILEPELVFTYGTFLLRVSCIFPAFVVVFFYSTFARGRRYSLDFCVLGRCFGADCLIGTRATAHIEVMLR